MSRSARVPGRNLVGAFFDVVEALLEPTFFPFDLIAERGTFPADLREVFFVRAMSVYLSKMALYVYSII